MSRTALTLLLILGATMVRGGVLSWTSNGPETGQVSVVRFDPNNPDVVWAGTLNQGIFKSSDGGLTWSRSSKGLINYPVAAIVVDPSSSSTMYAGNSVGEIYKSTDGGVNWVPSGSGLFAGGAPITAMVIDPSNPSTLYASTTSQAIYPSLGVQKSTNGGQSWANSGSVGLGTKNVFCLGIDRQNPSIVYAGGLFDNSDNPMFKTTNGGTSWITISSNLKGDSVYAIGVDPLVSGTLFISIAFSLQKSTNGGTTWTSGGSGLPFSSQGTAIVYEKNSSKNIWLSTLSDVYRTTNGGTSWTAAKIANERVMGLDVSATGTVVAGSATTGLYRRVAGAAAWTPANSGFLATAVHSLAADPTSPGVLYAGTDTTGLFKSTDHGRSWQLTSANVIYRDVVAIAIDPKKSSTVYAGTIGGSGLYKSTDGGATWKVAASLPRINALAIDPAVTDVIYAGTESGVSRSANGGTSFASASGGLPPSIGVVALTVDPTSTMTVYAGLRAQGLYKSADGGANWTKKGNGLTDPDVLSIAIDPAHPSTVFVATDGGGVFKSTDGGDSWNAANSGLPNKLARSLWIDPDDSRNVVVGTTVNGVFQSTDGGGNWSLLGGASPAAWIGVLAAEPGGIVIHAGSSGGAWSYQFRAFDPRITTTSPAEGAVIVNGTSIVASVSEFTLDCSTSGGSGQNRGHWRIDVDGALDSTGCSTSMQLAKTYPIGKHRIAISLRNPDDSALVPPAESAVNVTIVPVPPRRRAARR